MRNRAKLAVSERFLLPLQPLLLQLMSRQTTNLMLTDATERLAAPQSLQGLFHQHEEGYPLPSSRKLEEIVELARATLFPGYFGQSQVNIHTIKYQIGVNVERLYHLLCEQVLAGLGFVGTAGAAPRAWHRRDNLRQRHHPGPHNNRLRLRGGRQRVGDTRHEAELEEIQTRKQRYF